MSTPRRPAPADRTGTPAQPAGDGSARRGTPSAPTTASTAHPSAPTPADAPPGADEPGAGERHVQILDLPPARVRRPADLLHLLASVAGIAVVLIVSVYASSTTTGVTRDVQSALAQVVRSLLLVPVTVIEGLLILVLPVVVIVTQVLRRDLRGVVDAVIASAVAYLLALVAMVAILEFGPGTEVVWSLMRWHSGEWATTITPAATALSGLLTAVGSRGRRRVVAISWNLLFIALGISIITGDTTLVGAIVTVLIGRIAGMAMRYTSGVHSGRAHGPDLVDAIRRTGVEPLALVRVGQVAAEEELQPQTAVIPAQGRTHLLPAPSTRGRAGPGRDEDDDGDSQSDRDAGEVRDTEGEDAEGRALRARSRRFAALYRGRGTLPPTTSATVAAERAGQNRVYAVIGADGARWDVVVLDADRQVIGMLASIWSSLRLRGLERRTAVSLRQASERAALMYYAAAAAGVNSPHLRGIAEAGDSVLLIGEHIRGARSMQDLPAEQIGTDVMVAAWEQLRAAHTAGMAHRNVSAETILVGTGEQTGQVWLNGWEQGEIASTQLAQRVDRAQLLTALALHTDAQTAMDAARRALSPEQLAELAPLLQPVAFPAPTRAAARTAIETMATVRAALLEYIPEGAAVEPIRLSRLSARTVITLTIAVVALWIVVTTLNFDQVRAVVSDANPMWMLAAFGLGLVSYAGAGLALVAFSPERLGLGRSILVQVAASVLTLITPAGLGPAALSVRFMQRRGVRTSLALATVGLVQLTQLVSTIVLVVTLGLVLGTAGPLRQLPSLVVVITLVVVAVVAGAVLLVPPVRSWVLQRVLPSWRQIWPRLVWIVGQPQRLVLGVAGSLLVTVGFLAAFVATLHALGQSVPITTLAIVYLTGNTVGSAAPTPGGIGTVELALSAGLRTVGLATATAASAAVLFRLLTFWFRVPLGWVALRYLQRREDL